MKLGCIFKSLAIIIVLLGISFFLYEKYGADFITAGKEKAKEIAIQKIENILVEYSGDNISENMKDKIDNTNLLKPKPNIISNVTANEEMDVNRIKPLLIDQITSRVRWKESVDYMIKQGVNDFLEIGPGKVLSGLVKKISGDVKANEVITHSKSNILGNIKSKFASMGGKLKGNINSDQISIKKTADIEGVLNQKTLSIQEGAQLKIKTETYK